MIRAYTLLIRALHWMTKLLKNYWMGEQITISVGTPNPNHPEANNSAAGEDANPETAMPIESTYCDFLVSKQVLVETSTVFTSMLSSDCTEAHSSSVALPQFSPAAFDHFLCLLHHDHHQKFFDTASKPDLNYDRALASIPIAVYFCADGVLAQLVAWIEENPALDLVAAFDAAESSV